MLELGPDQAAAAVELIKDTTEATFMADVVDLSQEVPVIVDFWAPWCGPCKTLGPALEAAVTAAAGRVRLVKIDVDQNQGIAGQLRVQSIPAVFAFWKGQPVDGFQGALPPSDIQAFVERVAELAGDGGLNDAVAAAESMLADGDAADAAQTFAAILGEDPNNAAAYGGLVRAHLATGDIDEAEATLNGAPAEISETPEMEAAIAQIALARQADTAGPVAELAALADQNPADLQARFDLATALHASGDTEGAVAQLLTIFAQDRDWNDGAAKAQLFTIFDALKPEDPIALNGRRKLSSIIFA